MLDWIKKKYNSKKIKKQEQKENENKRSVYASVRLHYDTCNVLQFLEGLASETIYPGMFLSRYAAETENKTIYKPFFMPVTTNRKLRDIFIAVESPYLGVGIDDAYEKNQNTLVFMLRSSNTVLTKISSLQGTTLDRETELCHDCSGFLREITSSEKDLIIARSLDIDIHPELPRWTLVEIL